jgi:quinol-cytochrome oxidoreductase complex cytochrome b subunit
MSTENPESNESPEPKRSERPEAKRSEPPRPESAEPPRPESAAPRQASGWLEQASSWLSNRLGWPGIVAWLGARQVPRRLMFYLGGVTLFLAFVQVVTGILLLLYYRPDSAQAYGSVDRIVGELPYGTLVRSFHLWTSDLFVLCLFAHVFWVVVRRRFRFSQELTWLAGVGSALIGIGLAFTGSILPWNETAYINARVGSQLAKYVPFVGDKLERFMRGGDEVTTNTLGHAFGFHVGALPAALTATVALHLFFQARRPKSAAEEDEDAKGGELPLWPDFILRQVVVATTVFVAIMTLAAFWERPLGPPADPSVSPVGPRPPWYFLPVHQLIRSAPKELLGIDGARFLVGAACLLGLVAIALPFIDRRGSRITTWVAWILLFSLLVLTASALF